VGGRGFRDCAWSPVQKKMQTTLSVAVEIDGEEKFRKRGKRKKKKYRD